MDRGKLEELKRLHDDGVIDDAAYHRAVDMEIGGGKAASGSAKRKLEDGDIKVFLVAATAIVFVAIFIYWATVGFKPYGISDRDYGLAKNAMSVAEDYLNGSISASQAYEELDDIDGQVDDLGISLDISGIKLEIMDEHLDLGEADEDEIRSYLTELRKSIGYLF